MLCDNTYTSLASVHTPQTRCYTTFDGAARIRSGDGPIAALVGGASEHVSTYMLWTTL